MTTQSIVRRMFAGMMIVMFVMSAMVQARPMERNVFVQQDEKRKLPPVNWIRSRKIDVKHLDIDLSFDWDKEQAIGSTVVTFAPFADTDTFQLDAALMTIESVTLVGGGALKYTYDGKADNDNLNVTLDRVYRGGEEVKVAVVYKTNYVNNASDSGILGGFGQGLRFIKPTADNPNKPRQIWSQGESEFNRYWFPSYDSPNDFRTTDIRVTVAKPFFVVSNGKLMETKENADSTRTFYWKMEQPYTNYLTSIVVTETTPVVQDFDGIPVYNYGYVNETKEVAATTKNLPATMRFFSEVTGVKYPYAKYSQAFVEDFGGGMENISATTQIEEMILDERELLDTDSEGLQSHELAHQWFGDYVTCRDWGQIWLNESFATYMQHMWTEKLKGHDEFLYADLRNSHDQVLGSWAQGQRRPIVTKYYANKDAMFDNYAYPGGGSVLHMLRKHLGDKLFAASLKKYLTENAHQPVSTEDLRIAVEETSGQSMDWFFDQWLYKMGHPVFEVTQAYDAAAKKLTLNVKQTQKLDLNNEYPQTEFFQSYVDVNIDNKVTRVWMKPQAENVFTFDAAAKPKLVNWDYEDTLLKEMKFEKSTDDLLYQMANDKDVLGRRWAMGELETKAANAAEKERIVAALITSAEKDPFWRIRRAALSVIANIYSPDPPPNQKRPPAKLDANVEAAVIRLTKDKEAPIRSDAIELLGETQDKKYADIYLAALSDLSYGVIDYAASGLGQAKDPRAFDALAKLANTPSWKGRIQSAALIGLAWLEDKRGFEIGYKALKDTSLLPKVRSNAIMVVGLTGKGDPRAFDVVADRLKQASDAGNRDGVYDALYALVGIADPRGQPLFDAMKSKYKDEPNVMKWISELDADFKAAIKP
ncbi:MAG: HEAT repeat domain-containing protein [Chloracidobacterium sp.]|nr:HEAT repeat domain-containing protein [Chloracidobacterium sp.]